MIEEWRDVKGYEGIYQVSNTGEVRSLDRKCVYSNGDQHIHKGKTLTKTINNHGYFYISLCINSKPKKKFIHRLVAEAFIPNPENKGNVNHKDGNPLNNNVNNLEWATYKENSRHAFRTGLAHSTLEGKPSRTVKCIDTNETFYSASEAARKFGVSHQLISDVCLGKRKHAKGFRFCYEVE